MPIRRIAALFAASLAVAALGYTVYWFHAATVLRKGVEDWAEQKRAEGWQVTWDSLDTGGYPLHLSLTLAAPAVAAPDGARWRGEHLTAHATPFDPSRLRVTSPGRHVVAWSGGEAVVQVSSARLDVDLDRQGMLDDATLLASGISVDGLAGAPLRAAGLALTIDPLPVAHPDHTTATLRFSATAHDLTLPALPGLPLDREIGVAEITGRVLGALPHEAPAQALSQWSADGGTVELDHVTLEWSPMAMEAQGTVALDPNGQPVASLAARIRGFAPLMDRLAEGGSIPADTANAAKLMLMLMAKPDAKGRPTVPVPVSVQDGALYLGSARVARVPAINWQ
ncbi:MAG TPA: DUF2125 domain-containing protein [Magnetospirillum sp.]|nr:DUF2125 domain-containing protein [Magnetospirillum sp.]